MFSRWELLGKEVEEVSNEESQTFQRGMEKRYFEKDISPVSQISEASWLHQMPSKVKQD